MKRISQQRYQEMLADAAVLERDDHGEKVLAMPDGTLVKIFRRKRWLSTALLLPYARRFVRNARRLAGRGVLSVQVIELAYCPETARHLVTYQPLPGTALRQRLNPTDRQRHALLADFARYIALLHQKGVFFRSLHFGNVIVPEDSSGFGLIDVADMQLKNRPLNVAERARNFRHLSRYAQDNEALLDFGVDRFVAAYLAAAGLAEREQHAFRQKLTRYAPLFSGGAMRP